MGRIGLWTIRQFADQREHYSRGDLQNFNGLNNELDYGNLHLYSMIDGLRHLNIGNIQLVTEMVKLIGIIGLVDGRLFDADGRLKYGGFDNFVAGKVVDGTRIRLVDVKFMVVVCSSRKSSVMVDEVQEVNGDGQQVRW